MSGGTAFHNTVLQEVKVLHLAMQASSVFDSYRTLKPLLPESIPWQIMF
jgi:hypothetical protein